MSNIKLRFHLGAGKHYMHWQLKRDDVVSYHDPAETKFALDNVKLVNHKSTANKIHSGQNKTVCAWLRPEWIKPTAGAVVLDALLNPNFIRVHYNPRVRPYWSDDSGNNLDGLTAHKMVIINRQVWACFTK